jgi:hypothetical protein
MTDTKIWEFFSGFTNLELIEFKVPMVCLVTGCVSRRRDARYKAFDLALAHTVLAPLT